MASVAEAQENTGIESAPIDVQTIAANADLAWHMPLATSTRAAIDVMTKELVGYLELLRREDLGEAQDAVRLLRLVERHLAPADMPDARTPAHEAMHFMKDTSVFVKSLLALHVKKGVSAP